MADYGHVVAQAYRDILLREPDPGGLAHFASQMAQGVSEATVRDVLARSAEYAERFPGGAPSPLPPPPPPPSPPLPPGPMDLHVDGSRFVRSDGREVRLLGSVICCDAPDTPADDALQLGWPLVSLATLDDLAAHALNWTHVRLGPMSSQEPNPVQAYQRTADGRFDLTKWDAQYWGRLWDILNRAAVLGIYVELDLIDHWGLDHQVTPWSAVRNVQGFEGGSLAVTAHAPHPYAEAWLRKIVAETGNFSNVIYQDGNEAFKGARTPAWHFGIRDIVRTEIFKRGFPMRLIGTNTHDADIEVGFDYIERHDEMAQPHDPGRKPVMVNEYGDFSPAHVWAQIVAARTVGTSFHYWQGAHTTRARANMLAKMQGLVTGQNIPLPFPVPAECPQLVRWPSKVFNIMDAGFHPTDTPIAGGYVVVDSTPRFGPGRGAPCNAEHDNCGGRACEDPRGGLWTLMEGDAPMREQSDGYQVRVGPLGRGHYRVRVESRPDARDAEEGKPLKVAGGQVSSETEWDVA